MNLFKKKPKVKLTPEQQEQNENSFRAVKSARDVTVHLLLIRTQIKATRDLVDEMKEALDRLPLSLQNNILKEYYGVYDASLEILERNMPELDEETTKLLETLGDISRRLKNSKEEVDALKPHNETA